MIQGKDLMKGNVVEYNGYYAVVHSVFGPYPNLDERFNNKECVDLIIGGMDTVPIDEINPVILTEEILLKCGFEKKNDCEGYWINGLLFYNGFLVENQKTKIKYLHELQNLYYALTKQELEIKL